MTVEFNLLGLYEFEDDNTFYEENLPIIYYRAKVHVLPAKALLH